ncbi:MAG TPA: nitrate reductase [Chloroflexia bacterium]|nr:nitrate reductase [Chloroflexia bacterium]
MLTTNLPSSQAAGSRVTRSVCPYCGVGCGLLVESRPDPAHGGRLKVVSVKGDPGHPANAGALCSKGASLSQILDQPHRLLYPQVRGSQSAAFERRNWDDTLAYLAGQFRRIIGQYGRDAVAFYGSGQFLTEDYYVAQKLVKGFLGTNNFDANSRLCMSSAVAGYKLSLGQDGPPASYEDLDHADCFFIIGANMAACHPILFNRLRSRKKKGGDSVKVIVADPRQTNTAAIADHYLPVKPGGDLALLNAMLYVLREEKLLDETFIANHTGGWSELESGLDGYAPELVEELTGLSSVQIRSAALAFGRSKAALTLWSMGINQSASGVARNRAILNLHLATGQLGRPGAGPFSLTGQPNAMGGREAGGLSHLLPGQRSVTDPQDRAELEHYWQLPPGSIASQPGLTATEMVEALESGRLRAVWIAATNPLASLPDLERARRALLKADLVVVQDAYFPTESGQYAHVLLPAAQWAEREGVMTNSERRVSLVERGADPVGEARPDWQIFAAFARQMGFGEAFAWPNSEAVFEEFKELTMGRALDMTGLSYARLREGSLQWPCPDKSHPGTPRLYADFRFATLDGRAQFAPVSEAGLAEAPDTKYPFILTTGRVRDQWHTMTRTGHIASLLKVEGQPFVEIHSRDAALLKVQEGSPVELRSRRGRAVFKAVITEKIRPGTVFTPFHWGKLFQADPDAGVCNDLTIMDCDPLSKQPELKACAVALAPLVAAPRLAEWLQTAYHRPVEVS